MTPEIGPFCNFRKLIYISHKFSLITKGANPNQTYHPTPPPPKWRVCVLVVGEPRRPASGHCRPARQRERERRPPLRLLVAGGGPTSPATARERERKRKFGRNFKLRFRARFFEPRAVPPAKSKPSESTTSLGSQIFRSAAGCTQNEAESVGEQ